MALHGRYKSWGQLLLFPEDFCQVKERAKSLSRVQLCDPVDDGPPVASVHGILQNTGVDCHFLLPGIFQTQGVNLPVFLMSPALAGGFLYN